MIKQRCRARLFGGILTSVATMVSLAAAQPTRCLPQQNGLLEVLRQRHVAPTRSAIEALCSDSEEALLAVAESNTASLLARLRAVEVLREYDSAATRAAWGRIAQQSQSASLRWLAFKQLEAVSPANDPTMRRVATQARHDRSVHVRSAAQRYEARRSNR